MLTLQGEGVQARKFRKLGFEIKVYLEGPPSVAIFWRGFEATDHQVSKTGPKIEIGKIALKDYTQKIFLNLFVDCP